MSRFAFFLGLVLCLAGAGALAASIDLLPTELGLLYAACGAVAISGGFITLAIAALIVRIDALARAPLSSPTFPTPRDDYALMPTAEAPQIQPDAEPAPSLVAEEEPINENRSGRLPSLAGIEHALQEPETAPSLVGRYSAGGATYKIFSDGSIEAETDRGAFKFASMSEFKAHLADKRG